MDFHNSWLSVLKFVSIHGFLRIYIQTYDFWIRFLPLNYMVKTVEWEQWSRVFLFVCLLAELFKKHVTML